ncbi:MAG: hypothetical protein M3Q42_00735 [Pseudomonadota bacterium]|nr:hypothetical protein [Pseudomonadota bacterium]
MAIAREQARSLLTDSEMVLFGESRNPALRSLTDRELTRRIDRTRKLRDKARDLLQRQRLSSRQRTGNKGGKSGEANERTARKGEVLDDVLQRFEGRLQELERKGESQDAKKTTGAAKKAGTAKKTAGSATKAGPAKKVAGAAEKAGPAKKVSAARKVPVGQGRKIAAKATGDAAKKQPTARSPRKSAVSTEQALASTRKVLKAKQKQARKPRGYPGDHASEVQADPGYQSGQAKSTALELHVGEIRQEPIHGSISTRNRKNQARRDRV